MDLTVMLLFWMLAAVLGAALMIVVNRSVSRRFMNAIVWTPVVMLGIAAILWPFSKWRSAYITATTQKNSYTASANDGLVRLDSANRIREQFPRQDPTRISAGLGPSLPDGMYIYPGAKFNFLGFRYTEGYQNFGPDGYHDGLERSLFFPIWSLLLVLAAPAALVIVRAWRAWHRGKPVEPEVTLQTC